MARKRTGDICPRCGEPCYFEEKPTRNNKRGDNRYRYYWYAVHYDSKTGKRTSHSVNKFLKKKQTSSVLHESGDFIDLGQTISDEDFNVLLNWLRTSRPPSPEWLENYKRNQKTVINPDKPITNERLSELLNSTNDAIPLIAQYGLNREQIKLLKDIEKREYFEENQRIRRQNIRYFDRLIREDREKMKLLGLDRGGLRRKKKST